MRTLVRGVFCLAVLITPAVAQMVYPVQVDIPFPYHLGKAQLAAGTYRVERVSDSVFAVIFRSEPFPLSRTWNMQVKAALSQVIPEIQRSRANDTARVVFNKYGNDSYFVAAVWTGRSGVVFPKSKEELVTSRIIASAKPETVTIVARLIR